MKRPRKMKNYLKQSLLLGALSAVAGSAGAVDYYLAAKAFIKTMPDGSTVPMWGYVEDTGDGVNAHCYGITGAGSRTARNNCVATLSAPTAPGPRLEVPIGQTALRVFLTNGLPEPTSIVIPGQELPYSAANNGPTWNDNTLGSRGADFTKRVRSYGREAISAGGRRAYIWTNSRQNPISRPGTFIYHSGTHPQKQVYMGLYGAVTKDSGVGEAYPGVPYDSEAILFYSELDPDLNTAVNAGTLTTSIDYHAKWFLVNGEPYVDGVTADIAAAAAGSKTLLRYLSSAGETHVPTLQGLYQTIHAEDGIPYTWQNGASGVTTPAPREQYSVMLPPLKTKDAIITAPAEGKYAVYDGNGYMTNPSDPNNFSVGDGVGGMLRFLNAAAGTSGNQAPVAMADGATTPEETAVDINVLTNDTDPDPGDILSIVSVTQGSNGSVSISNPSCCVLYTPNPNTNGMDQFTYTISDNNGLTSTATAMVDVTVTAVNDAPSITSIPVTAATTSQPYSYDVDASDPDVGDTLTYALDLFPTGMSIDGTTGLISWTPTVQQSGSHNVTVRVTDQGGLFATQAFTLDVALANVAPVITSTAVTEAIVNTAYSYDVDAIDADLGDTQTYSLDLTAPAGMTIDAGTGVISWTPSPAQVGTNNVSVSVTDFQGLVATQSYQVDVTTATGPNALLYFSTAGSNAVPGVPGPNNNADIYAYDGAAFSRILEFVNTMGFNANVDALHLVDTDTFYVSFANTSVNITGIGVVQDEDVLQYDAGTWSVYFDGTAQGLTANGRDIDAISIDGTTLYFSTVGNANVGGLGAADDADVYSWDGTNFARVFDASANSLPGNADIDGLTVKGGTYYISFNRNGGTNVPGLGTVQDEAVVSFDGTNWALYFSGAGLNTANGQDIDSVHVP